MLRTTFKHTAAALCLLTSYTVSAQSLTGEIVIERDIQPAERVANRLGIVAPGIKTPDVKFRPLSSAPYNGSGQLSRSLTRLEPADDGDTLVVEPWKGYATIGYFPKYNLAASAGFRLIDTRKTRLATYLQYDGESYKTGSDNNRQSITNHMFTIGADMSTWLGAKHMLSANVAYSLRGTTMPWRNRDIDGGSNNFKLGLGYNSHTKIPFTVNLGYAHTGMRGDTPADMAMVYKTSDRSDVKPVSEDFANLNASVEFKRQSHSWSIDLDASVQHLSELAHIWPVAIESPFSDNQDKVFNPIAAYIPEGSHTMALFSLTPAYNLTRNKFNARLGIRADLVTGARGTDVRVAPDVHLTWTPSGVVAVWATVGGGEHLNTMNNLVAENPWLVSAFSYERSSVPFVVEGGLNFGPFNGFTAKIFGGYAVANNWLMPAVANNDINQFTGQDVRGAHYGIALEWQYRKLFNIHGKIEGATHGNGSKAYYLWRDRASWRANIGVTTTPVKGLDLSLDYNHAAKRQVMMLQPDNFLNLAWFNSTPASLGTISNLSFTASYNITRALTAFVNVDNLLCKRYQIIYGIPSARLKGLLGVQFKF